MIKQDEELKSQMIKQNEDLKSQMLKQNEELKSQMLKQNDELKSQMLKFESQMIKQNENLNSQITKQNEHLNSLIIWMIGIFLGGMGLMIGLLFWDRKTAIAPVEEKVKEHSMMFEKMQKIIAKLVKKDSDLKEFTKQLGLPV
ncbi:hypothetical protein GMMP1_690007 [Candidatus Magnetomoraceae bacterium gMMP-1]